MPVEDHEVHDKTKIGPDNRYECHNRAPFKEAYRAPQRRHGSNGYIAIFEFEAVLVPHRMSRECRYDMSLTDWQCEGCHSRGLGEAYAKSVREAASQ